MAMTDTWLTPPEIISSLGYFDLDPCTPDRMPWPTAKYRYTKVDNGLIMPWYGRIWLNPPYGRTIHRWMYKMAKHNNGISLTFARTDTEWFQDYILNKCTTILFLKGRIKFYNINGQQAKYNGGAATVLSAYGHLNSLLLKNSGLPGKYIDLNNASGGVLTQDIGYRPGAETSPPLLSP